MTGLDHLTESQRREAAQHDRAVEGYEPETLDAAYRDLQARHAWNRKDPEHRWTMARIAALARAAARMEKEVWA